MRINLNPVGPSSSNLRLELAGLPRWCVAFMFKTEDPDVWEPIGVVAGMTRPVRPEQEDDGDLAVQPADPEVARPPLYKVILHNDDYTPMEFVVEVLQSFFHMDSETAVQVMLTVHTQGKATCGIFTRDIAETKSHQVNQYARECQHPLLSDIEAAD